MDEKILSINNPKQVQATTFYLLRELKKSDWTSDAYLSKIIGNLNTNYDTLVSCTGLVRSSEFTELLSAKDAAFDRDYICTKNFVESNIYMRNEEIVEAAKKIWKIFTANDILLYRKSYEEQIASFTSLTEKLESVEIKPLVAKLIGVPESLALAVESHQSLLDTYEESNEYKAQKEKMIAPTIQQKVVRGIINDDLLPYLSTMARVNPDTYSETHKNITNYIEDVNSKARAKATRESNAAEEAEDENVNVDK